MRKLNDEERWKTISYRHTDIRKTFARELRRLAAEREAAEAEANAKVKQIKPKQEMK